MKIIKYISVYKYTLFFAILLGLFSIVITVSSPRLLAKIIDEFYRAITASMGTSGVNINLAYIKKIALLLILLYLLGSTLLYIQNYLISVISVKLTYKLKKEIVEKINRLPISYFDKVQNGDIMSRLTNDASTMTSMLSHTITNVFHSIVTIVGVIFMMYVINWVCATVAVIIVPIVYFSTRLIIKKSQRFFDLQQKLIGDINSHIEESYSQHNIIKAFNQEKQTIKNFDNINSKLYSAAWKSHFFSSLLTPIIFFLNKVNYLLVILVSSILTVKGQITIGDISSFIAYVKNLNEPLMKMAHITSELQKITAAAQRVFEFLEEEEEKPETNTMKPPKQIKGNIRFENVSFGYSKNEPVIKNVSFSIKAGQKAAFVGATGSGKSTIIKLLMRFYEIDSGNIYIDNVDIKNWSKKDLRSFFSIVLQDPWLYSGSIADNIKYSKSDATQQDIENAAKLAFVDSYINTLPHEYDTFLDSESNNISQGQKQLLTIARAIIADNLILILDEATSSVDIKTEQLIQKAIDNLMFKKTSVIIAHRLNTIKNADVIFVMSDGRIVESGSHEELIEKDGFYADMYFSFY